MRRRDPCWRILVAALGLALAAAAVAGAGAPPAREPDAPLPRSRAPHELGSPLPAVVRGAPPAGPVDTPAEYEENAGLLLAWDGFPELLSAIAVAVTTLTEAGRVWVVVDNAAEQQSVAAILTAAGADMARVGFIVATTDSVWIRDYGPRFIVDGGQPAIVDHTYNRPRPNDDAIPDVVAAEWGLPSFDLPLVHGGGNFHLFASGEAFMTELILEENPAVSEAEVVQYFADYEGLDLTIWDGFPQAFDSTRHIDMWMQPVREGVAILGRYDDPEDVEPRLITESATAELEGRGYTVLRTPGWNAGGTHYTYTNAVLFNELVFVPEYQGYAAENDEALAVFEAAFPDHVVIQLDGSDIVQYAGVFHCIVMHVPAATLFADGFESGDTSAWDAIAD